MGKGGWSSLLLCLVMDLNDAAEWQGQMEQKEGLAE
jgi:hypothetical protein